MFIYTQGNPICKKENREFNARNITRI
uniref:Uncharacterized protein n=1 Tax=Pyricularia oryzae (strain P131) TaxID=1143193 RepID=L7J7B8_PYRO1